MDYIFGSTTRDGVTAETLLTVGEAHSALTGETETRRTFPEGDLIDHFRIAEHCRSDEDGEGRCYDWYTIEGHYRYVDKTAAVEALSEENKLLKSQVSALTEQQSFYEDCIAEMAAVVYA